MSAPENNIEYTRKDLPENFRKLGLILAVVGLLIAVTGYFIDPVRSAFNNVMLLMFLASIGVGSLFLVALEYIGGAVWSTPFRRVSEFLAATLLILPIVAIPLFFNLHELFHWTHTEVVETDHLLQSKSSYLNTTFFIIRSVVYIAVWILFFVIITKNSMKQDESGDQILTKKNITLSAIFMPLFALTVTFSSIDWLMSLEPHWFSTIYGALFIVGQGLATFAFAIVALSALRRPLADVAVPERFQDLGNLMLAFVMLWAYMAFSQFLIIWNGNLPEEIG